MRYPIGILKKYLPLATAAILMAACASEDFVGNKQLHEANENGRPVSFGLVAAPQTRSVYGGEAAGLLNKNFVVWGDKTIGEAPSEEIQTVFDNYQLNYVTNSAGTTTSNSAGWEYVGYKNLPNGVSASETSQAVADIQAYANSSANSGSIDQTIKFWDYGASKYNFFAYSLGQGVEVSPATDPKTYTYAKVSAMSSSGYTVSGTGDQLKASYISNKKTISPSGSSGVEVELQFRHFASNVRMAFYETVPGYSVKNLQFYPSASGSAGDIPYLYAGSPLPTSGTYTVSFDTNGKAQVQLTESSATIGNIAFGTALTYTASKEYREPQAEGTTPYIGRSSDEATPTTEVTMLPNPSGTDLHLKVDYTLVSRDDSQEIIQVTGATATVPAVYAQWKPNYSYTYIFKITDAALDPITLDAVVNVDADGRQETITTVTEPEPTITTYQHGSDYATTDEYDASNGDIYVTVMDGLNVQPLTVSGEGTNARLYTATVEEGATQGITEETVANAIKSGTYDSAASTWTLTDGTTGKSLVVTAASEGSLTDFLVIPGTATPDGKPITIDGAKFTPVAGTTYVFQFRKCEYTPVTGLTEGTSPVTGYYTRTESEGLYLYTKITDEAAKAETDVTYYSYGLATPEKYQYKVIKVKE